MTRILSTLSIAALIVPTFTLIGCEDPHAMGNRSNATELDRDSRTLPGNYNGAGDANDNGRNPTPTGTVSGGSNSLPNNGGPNGATR